MIMFDFFTRFSRPLFDDFSPADFPLGCYEVLEVKQIDVGYNLELLSAEGEVHQKQYKNHPQIERGKSAAKGQKIAICRTDQKQGRWVVAKIL